MGTRKVADFQSDHLFCSCGYVQVLYMLVLKSAVFCFSKYFAWICIVPLLSDPNDMNIKFVIISHMSLRLCCLFFLTVSKPSAWRRQWHPTPVLLAGKFHGCRSLVGCSPWGLEESDMTERLHFHFSLSCIGEGNGNPLQCSCLENSRDGGTWWAAVYGVAQSRSRLKRLSSSSKPSAS